MIIAAHYISLLLLAEVERTTELLSGYPLYWITAPLLGSVRENAASTSFPVSLILLNQVQLRQGLPAKRFTMSEWPGSFAVGPDIEGSSPTPLEKV